MWIARAPEQDWGRVFILHCCVGRLAAAEQIKAKLGALRAVKQKAPQELATARQSLRQLMTLRQEAQLVLNGLLD